MYGAIIGDIIGSHYEKYSTKDYNFNLFNNGTCFTDDTVLTVSVCDTLLYDNTPVTVNRYKERAIEYAIRYKKYYKLYPNACYGFMFKQWAKTNELKMQKSFGNGASMRVIPIGYAFDDIEQVLIQAKSSALFTHNNIEAIKGAEAVASAVFFARTGKDKEYIKQYIERKFGYNLSFKIQDIKDTYLFDSRTSMSVPHAIVCFLEGITYEDVIRKAISLGGDADTCACIAGGIAEAYGYLIPYELLSKSKLYLDTFIIEKIDEFENKFQKNKLYQ